jgi:citrate synthase
MRRTGHLSAAEAAQELGVSRDTLYAYVSRGLIRSERKPGSRERRYRAEDVRMLLERKKSRRDPARATRQALHWGAPILESEISLIAEGELYYRGWNVADLARSSTFEDVAALLWGEASGRFPDSVFDAMPESSHLLALRTELAPLGAFQVALAWAEEHDPGAYDVSLDSVRRTGARILRLLAGVAVGARSSRRPIAEVLQRAWCPDQDDARSLLEAALVLWADHELNVSTFTGRCVASTAATPYAVVVAGLSALGGPLHGGATHQTVALLEEVGSPDRARAVLEARLRRGERIPGFGQPLYPEGDPRGRVLLDLIREVRAAAPALAVAEAVEVAAFSLLERHPNVDFAAATLARVLGLPPGSGLALIAISRSAGWIAHALEQYAARRLIRPRARYVGPPPR